MDYLYKLNKKKYSEKFDEIVLSSEFIYQDGKESLTASDKRYLLKVYFDCVKIGKLLSYRDDFLSYIITRLNSDKEVNFKSNCALQIPRFCLISECEKYQAKFKRRHIIFEMVLSFFAGIINGLFGGGAGMLVVPILKKVCGLDTKRAHATAVFVVFPLCVASLIAYILFGVFDFGLGLPVCVGVLIGGCLGAFLLKKINSQILQFAFALSVILAGVKLFIDCVGEFL